MNLEQLAKKVDWLEGQKRETDKLIKTLNRSIDKLIKGEVSKKETLVALTKQIKTIDKDVRKLDPLAQEYREIKSNTDKRFDQVDINYRKQFSEFTRSNQDAQRILEKDIFSAREELGAISSLQIGLRERAEKEAGLDARLASLEASLKDMLLAEAAREELAAALEQNRISIDQRISEAMGTVDAVNERMESVNQIESEQQKLTRDFTSIQEDYKKQELDQRVFIEAQTAKRLEEDRTWAEREDQFQSFATLSTEVDKRLEELESIDIAVNRAQEKFNQLIEKIDRRVNELTEVQRLGEQRLRKEWTTFQADTQKRWTGYVLGQEEAQVESNRLREKIAKQIKDFEAKTLDISERLDHLDGQNEQFLQGLLESVRGAISEGDRFERSLR